MNADYTFRGIFNAIGVSLSNFACSDDEENGDDEEHCEEDTELGMLSEDDEPHWVMGTIGKFVQKSIVAFRQKQMKLNTFVQLEGGHGVDFVHDRDVKDWIVQIKIPAVDKPRSDQISAAPAMSILGQPIRTLNTVSRTLQMPQVRSGSESSHMRQGFRK
jgi:hypothetical protein